MATVEKILRSESDGTISFGDYTLAQKEKMEDFKHAGDLYKVKTYSVMTKLEKNGMFLYESVPGTSVSHFQEMPEGVVFSVEGKEDSQITIGLNDDTSYDVFINDTNIGTMSTSLGGKLNISVELADAGEVKVKVVQA